MSSIHLAMSLLLLNGTVKTDGYNEGDAVAQPPAVVQPLTPGSDQRFEIAQTAPGAGTPSASTLPVDTERLLKAIEDGQQKQDEFNHRVDERLRALEARPNAGDQTARAADVSSFLKPEQGQRLFEGWTARIYPRNTDLIPRNEPLATLYLKNDLFNGTIGNTKAIGAPSHVYRYNAILRVRKPGTYILAYIVNCALLHPCNFTARLGGAQVASQQKVAVPHRTMPFETVLEARDYQMEVDFALYSNGDTATHGDWYNFQVKIKGPGEQGLRDFAPGELISFVPKGALIGNRAVISE